MRAAVLFARSDSIYKTLPGLDVYDIERDARNFTGGLPVVAHPPCRAWGRLRKFANPRPGEKELGVWAVGEVRKNGGVLEHPAYSTLWEAAEMPLPRLGRDKWGGWTLPIHQFWFGHKAEKPTWLYVVGVEPGEMPELPMVLGEASHVVRTCKGSKKPRITKPEREHTPELLAQWLVDVAARAARVKTCGDCGGYQYEPGALG